MDEPSIDPVDLPEAGPAPPACKLQERVKFHVLLTSYEMLSAESASGRYPVPAVDMMNRIIERCEASISWR